MSHPGDSKNSKASDAPVTQDSEEATQASKQAKLSDATDSETTGASAVPVVAAATLPSDAELPAYVHLSADAARALPSPPAWCADLEPLDDDVAREKYVEWELAAGRCLIQYACDHLYAPVEPYPQFTSLLKWRQGGPDPIDYCNAYTTLDKKCWHYISMGFSQLYPSEGRPREYIEKVKGASFRGQGFELTFRLVKRAGEDVAPMWPFQIMQQFGLSSKRGAKLYPGAILATDGPVFTKWKSVESTDSSSSSAPKEDEVEFASTSEALVLLDDPQLMPFENAYSGEPVYFLQLVGITKKELDSLAPIYHPAVAIEFVQRLMHDIHANPLYTTDLSRQCSFVKDPVKAQAIVAEMQGLYASIRQR